jgi:hypothetical protein
VIQPIQEAPEPAPAPVAAQPNGTLTDIGHGLAAGTMVDLPKMIGQAMQAFGIAPELGKSLVDGAKSREDDPAYQTTGAWGEGARGVPMTALAILSSRPTRQPRPGAAIAGPVVVVALLGAPCTAAVRRLHVQDVKERALEAGATPEEAQ